MATRIAIQWKQSKGVKQLNPEDYNELANLKEKLVVQFPDHGTVDDIVRIHANFKDYDFGEDLTDDNIKAIFADHKDEKMKDFRISRLTIHSNQANEEEKAEASRLDDISAKRLREKYAFEATKHCKL